jgi:hypothetical protein
MTFYRCNVCKQYDVESAEMPEMCPVCGNNKFWLDVVGDKVVEKNIFSKKIPFKKITSVPFKFDLGSKTKSPGKPKTYSSITEKYYGGYKKPPEMPYYKKPAKYGIGDPKSTSPEKKRFEAALKKMFKWLLIFMVIFAFVGRLFIYYYEENNIQGDWGAAMFKWVATGIMSGSIFGFLKGYFAKT